MATASKFSAILSLLCCTTLVLAQDRVPFIINGTPTDAYPAVGIVGEVSVGGFCTGTLISPNHVLTAAHCAEAILDFGSAGSGTFEVGGRVYRTIGVEIMPSYNARTFTNDVAILVLSEPVTDVEPVALSAIPPEVGEVVTIVGFGGQGTPQDGSDGSFGEKSVGMATVDNVSDTEFSWDFDDPSESNPAPGDSGGPVFIDTGSELLLAGIVSSGTQADAGLGDTNFNMRVDAFEDFITDTVNDTQAVLDELEEVVQDDVSEDVDEPVGEPEESEVNETVDDVGEDGDVNGCPQKGYGNRWRNRGRRCNDDGSAADCLTSCPSVCPADEADTSSTDAPTTTEVEENVPLPAQPATDEGDQESQVTTTGEPTLDNETPVPAVDSDLATQNVVRTRISRPRRVRTSRSRRYYGPRKAY